MIKKPGNTNQVRIIGGLWKRSVIRFVGSMEIRPTPDRVRETLFNWLAPDIRGAHCLDLFAGSGVLGLEALSRGATSCTWIEQDSLACQSLEQSIIKLKASNTHMASQVIKQHALIWLSQPSLPKRYDIVFMDPPYQSSLLEDAIKLIGQQHPTLYQQALFYLENNKPLTKTLAESLQPTKTAHYGQVYFGLYKTK